MTNITGNNTSETLTGGAGDDVIDGLSGDDLLQGLGGADILIGGRGDDALEGGAGADIFRFSARGFDRDTIRDFAAGQDLIDLSALGIADMQTLSPFIRQAGPDTVIEFAWASGVESITILNTAAASLTAANFLFRTSSAGLILDGLNGNDVLFGGLGADRLNGLLGDDTLTAGSGDDVLNGGRGDDYFIGGPGADRFIYLERNIGRDTIADFRQGEDRIDLSTLGIADFQTLVPFLRQIGPDAVIQFTWGSVAETITIQNVAAASLTAADFVFDTSASPVTFDGISGNDVLFGGLGVDRLNGLLGDDVLTGGGGGDFIDGGRHDDRLSGGAGADRFLYLEYGFGQDTIVDFTRGQDRIDLSALGVADLATLAPFLLQVGPDAVIRVAWGSAVQSITLLNIAASEPTASDFVFNASSATLTLNGLSGNDVLFGGLGADRLDGELGDDVLAGGSGNDVLTGDRGDDVLIGGAGTDIAVLSGARSAYTITTNADGSITVSGTDGVDTLIGMETAQFTDQAVTLTPASTAPINGAAGADTLTGRVGDDVISGFGGVDIISGLDGADRILGGLGADYLVGGDGADTFAWTATSESPTSGGFDAVADFETGLDRLDFSFDSGRAFISRTGGSSFVYFGQAGGGFGGLVQVTGAVHGYDILSGGPGVYIYGQNGVDDDLRGGGGADIIAGFSGADIIRGGAGSDQLYGGAGADRFVYARASDSTTSAYDAIGDFAVGEDVIDLTGLIGAGFTNIALARLSGTTFIYFAEPGSSSYQGAIHVLAEVQAADLQLGGAFGLTFYGTAGADTLRGGAGADTVLAGNGADVVSGGAGADNLFGGAGADRFIYISIQDSTATAFDTIRDFQVGVDKIDLRGVADSVFLSNFGGSTFVYFGANGSGGFDGLIVVSSVSLTQADVLVTGENATMIDVLTVEVPFPDPSPREKLLTGFDDPLDPLVLPARDDTIADVPTGLDLWQHLARTDLAAVDPLRLADDYI